MKEKGQKGNKKYHEHVDLDKGFSHEFSNKFRFYSLLK